MSHEETAATDKAVLEAAFAEAMMSQPPAAPPESDRRGRVFSFTGGLGSRQVSQSSQAEEDVSPAFGKRTAPRPTGVDERLQRLEELVTRSHEALLRQSRDLEVGLPERCGRMVQQVLESMVPHMVEALLDRLEQSLDFTELRDQLVDAIGASTELLPLLEERSQVVVATLEEERMVHARLVQDVSRTATAVETLAANSTWQVPVLERLEDLQRSLQTRRSDSTGSQADVWTSRPPQSQAGGEKPPPKPKEVAPGLQGLQNALRRRPDTADRIRRPPQRVSGQADPTWYTSKVEGVRPVRSDQESRPMSRPSSGKPNDWPWQPPNVAETWKEEEMVAPSPMIPLVSSSSRSKPSDFFGRKNDADR